MIEFGKTEITCGLALYLSLVDKCGCNSSAQLLKREVLNMNRQQLKYSNR